MSKNEEIKIERGKPIPYRSTYKKYPWKDMKHGDSILIIPKPKQTLASARNTAFVSAKRWLHNNKPTWRVITRTEGKGIRLWLIDPKIG